MRNLYILMGPPGSGKGTLSLMCTEELGWGWISTGNLCRFHIAKGTEIGQAVDSIVKSGNLIPDDLIGEMVFDWLMTNGSSYKTVLLDGYPRTVAQAQLLCTLIREKFNSTVRVSVVRLMASDSQVKERLMGRYLCKSFNCQLIYSAQRLPKAIEGDYTCQRCGDILVRRPDDSELVIQDRLRMYHKYENDLLEFYRTEGIVVFSCDGEKPLGDVFNEFKTAVNCTAI